jgi:tRNA pseudouridine32 synthase/23S rRNA pseudouridine746 synthase
MKHSMSNIVARQEAHVLVESLEGNAVDLLHRGTGLSKQQVKSAMTKGAVWLTRGRKTQRLRRAKRALRIGDGLHLYYDASVLAEMPPEPILLADLGGYTVWRKPYGLRSQGSKWGDHCTVARWAEQHLQPERPALTVHRLDRAANGLILMAHSGTMAAALSTLFRERKLEKHYRAIVAGDMSSQPLRLRVEQPIDDRAAISEVSFLQLSDDGKRSLVDVSIETGRKHQIRRHLAGLGHPVIGDRRYGTGTSDDIDLQLTAYRLAFDCPVENKPTTYSLPNEYMPVFS